MSEKRNVLVHVHIFKNAGSSFDDALTDFFKQSFVDHRDDKNLIQGKMDYLVSYLDTHTEIQAFSSHSIHFIPQNTEKYQFLPTYFLRHPIARIRSVYSFEKKQLPATEEGAIKAKELTLNEYIVWYMQSSSPATLRNAQTIFLSGDGPNEERMLEKYDMALNTINHSFLVGVVDRYDESMVVFEEYLKDFFPYIDLSYRRQNITDDNLEASVIEKAEKLLSRLDVSTQALVIENNKFDVLLYDAANKQLDLKINNIQNFQQKLDDFKDRCLLKLIYALEWQNNYLGIVELLDSIVQKGTNDIRFHLFLANAKKELKDYSNALKDYENIIQKFPNNPWAYFYFAEIYYLMGEIPKSKELFTEYAFRLNGEKDVLLAFQKYIG